MAHLTLNSVWLKTWNNLLVPSTLILSLQGVPIDAATAAAAAAAAAAAQQPAAPNILNESSQMLEFLQKENAKVKEENARLNKEVQS